MYYSYILYSPQSKDFHISHSDDLKKDVKLHNEGRINNIKRGKPWTLIWYSGFSSKQKSIEFEEFLKTEMGQTFMQKWLIPSIEIPSDLKPQNAETCPICGGAGKAATQSFFKYGKRYSGHMAVCLTCTGKGWIDPAKKTISSD